MTIANPGGAAALAPGDPGARATVAEFQRLDIRVGRVVSAEPFPEARKPAIKLSIDFGPLGVKRSSAQITALYEPAALIGRLVVAVVNFPPRQIANFVSDVLVLGATTSAGIVLLQPDADVPSGSVVA